MRISDWSSDVCSSDLGDHRQAADELGDQAELDQVLGPDLGQHLADPDLALGALELCAEANPAGVGAALLDDLVEACAPSAVAEQKFEGVDLREPLFRMLVTALRLHPCQAASDHLQQRPSH